ncbi:hypothetical protein AAV35_000505 [Salimicrobium jeotgali]|uniref:Uncharacterized protein n=1 Tax=Salimicrobium jeotgali TaxID=1230341 RepID=K2GKC5_9BACI|nr:hypothetical protein AAV35_000505 [Salimicrobium jeotgali]EKE30879.1 hypothetical protein MJ3_11280 [Salimicrobium jeotgali]MBM7697656.1 hypothetical protein [Salimicrobium jeotgali]
MAKSSWKSYTFLILSVLVFFTCIAFFVFGFANGNQSLLNFMYYLLLTLGITSVIMGVWSFISKLAWKKTTISASILTIINFFIFSFFF